MKGVNEMKNFHFVKDDVKKMRSAATDLNKTFEKHKSKKKKNLLFKICKENLKLNNVKINHQIKKWAKT